MAEQLICNQQVDGSTPFTSSNLIFYGGIPERPKGADCKSVVTDFAGPNPASPTKNRQVSTCRFFIHCESNGISSRASVHLITEGVYHQPQVALYVIATKSRMALREARIE